ncbi:MAG TPA: SDR family NAD(P)-dependent oxidoreductase [Terracidiphilus sp.]|nr:SDR family NAD(P)-dependent oxidoreductase [Terracidiphilus sp.]
MEKTALITGASSGIGLLTSVVLAKRGWRVLATMRDLSKRDKLESAAKDAGVLERIEVHALDVTNAEQIAALAGLIGERKSPLHALINNAGFVMSGFAENVSDAELRRQFDTNFFGTAALTRALLPIFKRQTFGHIVMISSISGRVGFPGVGSYSASKFALEGWTETLRLELKPMGIHVVLVEPGAFETDIWTRNALVSEQTRALVADPQSPEGARIVRWRKKLDPRKKRSDPQLVAEFVAGILRSSNPRLRYSFGMDAWAALVMRTMLPWSWFERMLIKSSGIEG